jgi:hypothetical protein
MKVCTKCGLPKTDFYPLKSGVDGFASECKECSKKRSQQWRESNRIRSKQWRRGYKKIKRLEPLYRVREALAKRVLDALKGKAKSARTLELLGCSVDDLKKHLENQFKNGMEWKNYGSLWNIDHRIPCASFNLLLDDQQKKCFHFSNLQPLFVLDNRLKSDKIL